MRFKLQSLLLHTTLLLLTSTTLPAIVPAFFPDSAIAQTTDARKAEADRLLEQGNQQYQVNQYEAAIQSWETALKIYREIGDHNGEASVLTNRGVAYTSLSRYTDAIEQFNQALPIFREVQNRKGETKALNNRGNAYLSLSRYSDAIEQYNQALPIYREVKDRNGEATALGSLGIAYRSLNRYSEAIDQYNQALTIFREVKDRNGEAKTLMNRGNAYADLLRHGEAIGQYNQALTIFREVKDRNGEAKALMNRGIVYADLLRHGEAIGQYNQALTILQAIKDRDGEAKALNNLGSTYFKTNQLTQAESILRQAIALYETIRLDRLSDANKISLFENQARTYRILQQVLVAQNQPEAALTISEWGRAKALVELLAARSTSDTPKTANLQQSAAPTIQQLRQVAQSQNATLVQYSIITEDVKRTREDQAPSEASRLYIWVIQPTGKITFRNVDLKPLLRQQALWELVLISRGSIGVRGLPRSPWFKVSPDAIAQIEQANAAQAKANLQRLHQMLIARIADLLPQDPNQHVIFMPERALYLVPFAALQDSNGKYLIEQHTLLTAPSIQTLALTQQQARQQATGARQKALVVGNPTMPKLTDGRLDPLPGAAQEATAIARFFGTQSLIGNQATKAAIVRQMPQASIIHLATHGLVDTYNGFGSVIALAPDRPGIPDDGLLTAAEIFGMKLKAQLVVLSACDTGRGRITGDGVVGLSRSLITAGVPSVMVSLWSVPDAPTADLMIEFYKNWQQRKLDKAQALRQAMLTMMKTHPNPRDWAAFTLLGEAE